MPQPHGAEGAIHVHFCHGNEAETTLCLSLPITATSPCRFLPHSGTLEPTSHAGCLPPPRQAARWAWTLHPSPGSRPPWLTKVSCVWMTGPSLWLQSEMHKGIPPPLLSLEMTHLICFQTVL